MQPIKNEFYNAVERMRKDKDISEKERDCFKAKCVELRDDNDNLKAELDTSEARNSNLANIVYKQDRFISHQAEQIRTKDHQINTKIAQQLESEKQLSLKDAKIAELEALLFSQLQLPLSNAEIVRGQQSEVNNQDDGHVLDG